MPKLVWNKEGERFYESGIDRAVLYVKRTVGSTTTRTGFAWNGLVSLDEKTEGGEVTSLYFDGVKTLDLVGTKDFAGTIQAYMHPEEFYPCVGSVQIAPGYYATNQSAVPFSLSYRTQIGNDLQGLDYGYKLHLLYNLTASPSDRSNQTVNQQENVELMSWDISAVPLTTSAFVPTAHFIINSKKVHPTALGLIETILYGAGSSSARLPDQTEIVNILSATYPPIPPVVKQEVEIDGGTPVSSGRGSYSGGDPGYEGPYLVDGGKVVK